MEQRCGYHSTYLYCERSKDLTCTVCNATKTESVGATGHSYGSWGNHSSSQHKQTCTKCGNAQYGNHSWNSGVVTTEPTYTDVGIKTYTCSDCKVAKTEEIPKLVAPENAPGIVLGKYECIAGETIEITVALKNNPGIASMILDVSFDEDVLTLKEVEYNTEIGGQTVMPSSLTSPVTLYWINAFSNSNGDFILATLTFEVNKNAENGSVSEISVTYAQDNVYNVDEENVFFATENGEVSIIDYVPGDINGDGVCNNKDVSRLMQFYAGWNVEVNAAALDVNGDGSNNNKDVTRLMQFLAGWSVEIH